MSLSHGACRRRIGAFPVRAPATGVSAQGDLGTLGYALNLQPYTLNPTPPFGTLIAQAGAGSLTTSSALLGGGRLHLRQAGRRGATPGAFCSLSLRYFSRDLQCILGFRHYDNIN